MGIIENKQGYLTVSGSTFEDNNLDGSNCKGIIYVSQTTAVGNTIVNGNYFHDNAAAYAIWISAAPTTVEYNAFDLAEGQYAIGNNKNAVVTVNYNWFGTNDNPSALLDNVSTSNWVIMNVEPASAENIEIGATVPITVDFNHYTDGTAVSELADKIPELKVSAAASNGNLDKAEAITENGQASFVYTAVAGGEDTVNIASSGATVPVAIAVNIPVPPHDVYVSKDGNDENDGSEDAPVATIAKAIELANENTGKIFINEGTYTETNFTVSKDLTITGTALNSRMWKSPKLTRTMVLYCTTTTLLMLYWTM